MKTKHQTIEWLARQSRSVPAASPNPRRGNFSLGQVKLTVTFTMLMSLACMQSRGADVSFYTIYKGEKYAQASSGAPTLWSGNPYRFGAVVAPSVSGSVLNATVSPLGGAAQALTPDAVYPWLSLAAKYATQAALDSAAPSGNYTLVVNTLNQGQKTLTLNLPAETFPSPPHISNWSAGQAIDPTADFRLSWDPFSGGTTNDLILVLVGIQTNGLITFRTPGPLQAGALDGTATSVVIPAADLKPNTSYAVEITFFKVETLDTNSYPGASGIVGFESFTDAALTTTRGADVSFYTIYKGENYVQASSGAPTLWSGNPFRFGAIVAPSVSGSVVNATVSPPGGAAQALDPYAMYPWLSLTASNATQAALDSAAPAGNYTLVVNTLNQSQKTLTLNLPVETFPSPPHISNWTASQAIDPTADFRLSWDPFPGGTTNDFIFVLMGIQTNGLIAFGTPGPLQAGALDGTATSVVIPAADLKPNTSYAVEITFFKVETLDTNSYPGASGIVGFESFTDAALITTAGPIQFSLSFQHLAQGGSFLNNTNATPAFPVPILAYRTELIVRGTTNLASPAQVLVTGPSGSGLTNAACAFRTRSTAIGWYFSPLITQPATAPGGAWSVSYAGAVYDFTEPDPQAASHLVIPIPRVGVVSGVLQNVTWSYFDPEGNALTGTPVVLTSIQVQTQNSAGSFIYYDVLNAATTSYTFPNSLAWTNVSTLRLQYQDTLNNSYIVLFPNVITASPVELAAVRYSAGGFVLRLTGQAGRDYLIQFSTDLLNWTNLTTTNLPTATIQLADPQAGQSPYRFYRAKLAN